MRAGKVYAFDELELGEEDALSRRWSISKRPRASRPRPISDLLELGRFRIPRTHCLGSAAVVQGGAGTAWVDALWVSIERVERGGFVEWRRAKATSVAIDESLV